MQLIFWQKNISIHQSSFLRALANEHKVTLVVIQDQNSSRKVQGWHIPDFGETEIIVGPNYQEIQDIIKKNLPSIHVFSGFFTDPMIRNAYLEIFQLNIQVFFMLEPFDNNGLKGKLRFIKYSLFIRKYKIKILSILVTGEKAKSIYIGCGMPEDKIFSWGYFTESPGLSDLREGNEEVDSLPEVVFVGQFIPRKNIFHMVEALNKQKGLFRNLTLIGGGQLEKELFALRNKYNWVKFKPFLPNVQLIKEIAQMDLLILPSKFDGWGAVVNEALQAGTPVITSENCGAACLLDGDIRGEVFSFSGKNNLEKVLKKRLLKGKVNSEQRKAIKVWSEQNISGETAANYFSEIIEYSQNGASQRPEAPWLKHKFKT